MGYLGITLRFTYCKPNEEKEGNEKARKLRLRCEQGRMAEDGMGGGGNLMKSTLSSSPTKLGVAGPCPADTRPLERSPGRSHGDGSAWRLRDQPHTKGSREEGLPP